MGRSLVAAGVMAGLAFVLPAPGAVAKPPLIKTPSGLEHRSGQGAVVAVPIRYRADGGRARITLRLRALNGRTATLTRRVAPPRDARLRPHSLRLNEATLARLLGPNGVGPLRVRTTVRHRHRDLSSVSRKARARSRATGRALDESAQRVQIVKFRGRAPLGSPIASLYNSTGKNDGSSPSLDIAFPGGVPTVISVYADGLQQVGRLFKCGEALFQGNAVVHVDPGSGSPFEENNASVSNLTEGEIDPPGAGTFGGLVNVPASDKDPFIRAVLFNWSKVEIKDTYGAVQCRLPRRVGVYLKAVEGFY